MSGAITFIMEALEGMYIVLKRIENREQENCDFDFGFLMASLGSGYEY